MGFLWYNEFYGEYVGIKIRGAVGKKWIYQVVNNVQKKYPYVVPSNPRTAAQQAQRDLLRNAVNAWHALTDDQRNVYRRGEPYRPTMSGYNFFISSYIKLYI